jgi:hypothetical protein
MALLTVRVDAPALPKKSLLMAGTSPRVAGKPRLSFDESAIQRLEEDKRRQSEASSSAGNIQETTPPPLVSSITTISGRLVPESILRRASSGGGDGVSVARKEPRPSLYSSSSHPSLQEDMCSEIAHLDNLSEHGGPLRTGLGIGGDDDKVPGFRRFVGVFQVACTIKRVYKLAGFSSGKTSIAVYIA